MTQKKSISVCSIVVTFQPEMKEFTKNVATLLEQTNHVFIVDNTPKNLEQAHQINHLSLKNKRITLIQNGENRGIATALNQGIKAAISKKFDYIATFDQDSSPQQGMVENLVTFLEKNGGDNCIATPQIHDKLETNITTATPQLIDLAITSGMVFPSKIPKKYGLMVEKLFIDYVDIEYSLRLRKGGAQLWLVPGAMLQHSLGNLSELVIFGKHYYPTNHSAFRRYFITRNRIFVWFTYIKFFPKYVLKDIKSSIIEAVLIVLIEQDKIKKVFAMLRGFKDALFNNFNS